MANCDELHFLHRWVILPRPSQAGDAVLALAVARLLAYGWSSECTGGRKMLPGGEPTPVLLVGDMPTTAPLLRFMRYMPLATRSRSRLISGAYASHTRSAEAASSMRSFIRSCRGEHYLINLNPRIYGLGGARGRRWSELARHLGRSVAQSTTKRNVGGYRDDASYRQEEHDARALWRMMG